MPAYSEVFYGRGGVNFELAVTLAVHNTGLDSSIMIQSVRYYDTNGNVVRNYISEPVEVSPLATTGFLVQDSDRSSGQGVNLSWERVAEEPVHEPIMQAIMVSTREHRGFYDQRWTGHLPNGRPTVGIKW